MEEIQKLVYPTSLNKSEDSNASFLLDRLEQTAGTANSHEATVLDSWMPKPTKLHQSSSGLNRNARYQPYSCESSSASASFEGLRKYYISTDDEPMTKEKKDLLKELSSKMDSTSGQFQNGHHYKNLLFLSTQSRNEIVQKILRPLLKFSKPTDRRTTWPDQNVYHLSENKRVIMYANHLRGVSDMNWIQDLIPGEVVFVFPENLTEIIAAANEDISEKKCIPCKNNERTKYQFSFAFKGKKYEIIVFEVTTAKTGYVYIYVRDFEYPNLFYKIQKSDAGMLSRLKYKFSGINDHLEDLLPDIKLE
eukprot:GHVP01046877.1.p1 GENE.GHVP01046877.1~~GHVP01046877.1.p1  ORF type:complete len:331 (+),score=36.34 GHVP01046877.1:76-993(+)